jgi:NAD dependent epimerase/dehydratase
VTLAGTKVLVTGAEGFIGSHVVEALVADGADVRAFTWYDPNGRRGWLDTCASAVVDAVEMWPGDVRDRTDVTNAVRGCDVVLHLAALISIPHSYRAPEAFVATNVTGTLNLLEACRDLGVRRLVQTSTSEVYGTPDTVPITEDHPLKGQSPYSATKIAADKLCEAYACSFGLPVTVLRPFNTFGPRQSTRAVIPTILGQLLTGRTELRLGSLAPQRDFTFVTDTARAFVLASEADLEPGAVVQLGTGVAVSVGDVVDAAGRLLGVTPTVVTDDTRVRPDASEVQVLLSDPSRAAAALGWKPEVDFADGLAATAAWLREHGDPTRAETYGW